MQFNDLSEVIIGCTIEVHKQPGAGLLESAFLKFAKILQDY
jgi:hypothetical protein